MLWFKPKSPVTPEMREWVDRSMQRFIEMFGREALTMASVVTPTDACFPDDWNGTGECAEKLLARVCHYMGVPSTSVVLEIFIDEVRVEMEKLQKSQPLISIREGGALGLYHGQDETGKFVISINQSTLRDINKVIATMAHELGHVLLLGAGRIGHDEPDMEPLTDLITVFRGVGIFSANTAVSFQQHNDGQYEGWSVKNQGYLSENTYGYSLAVFAHLRGEINPKWTRYLKLNVRTYFKQAAALLAYDARR